MKLRRSNHRYSPSYPSLTLARNLFMGGTLLAGFCLGGCSDPGPQEGKATPPQKRDRDGDGIPDIKDSCPEKYAPMTVDGCPQPKIIRKKGVVSWPKQKDTVPATPPVIVEMAPDKSVGQPPVTMAPAADSMNASSADADKDGIPDSLDKCPKVKGIRSLDGCPPQRKGSIRRPPRIRTAGKPIMPRIMNWDMSKDDLDL
ncbi:thrombospondin type 3 repeat-containing protein [Myxococcota bacterium]|nr:thrombospondin type 3 repeat-containing protein [Myxococcota bacterium]MBU1533717.1 thrombospondin type 3 repeat-containing protein [Myxococcota bacterium]